MCQNIFIVKKRLEKILSELLNEKNNIKEEIMSALDNNFYILHIITRVAIVKKIDYNLFYELKFKQKHSILIKPFGKKARKEVLYIQMKKYIKLLALIVTLLIVKEFDD